jgi:hypothetical protein
MLFHGNEQGGADSIIIRRTNSIHRSFPQKPREQNDSRELTMKFVSKMVRAAVVAFIGASTWWADTRLATMPG